MIALPDRLALCYHALSPEWPAVLSVTPERFAWQLGWLADRGYEAVTFSELALGRREGRRVAVTFDDGYLSVLRYGLPVIARLGWVATVFVPTALIDGRRPLVWPGIEQWVGTEHEDELTPLTWAELTDLQDRGWEIGSHTRTHPRLTALGATELDEQLRASRVECESATGTPCLAIAYPYGDTDAGVAAAARRAGYAAGAALPERRHRVRPLEWPRVGVYHGDDELRFRAKVSRVVRLALRTPVREVAGALRRSDRA